MMGIGFPELMVILVIIMIIFGAGKLPQIGSAFGQSIRNFKTSMKEAEELDKTESKEAAPVETENATVVQDSSVSDGAALPPSAGIPKTPTAPPAPQPVANSTPAQAAPKAQPANAQKSTKPSSKKKKADPGEKSFEEELIEQAIKEIKDKRVGTIRTPHDGLVQQGDVFTKSVDKTPWHMKGRDKGVNRDVM
ncbi:MAG: twin-arginine translocase TatA/TatE family subunit [Candidatus Nitronauta litoralis]|uniref:Sec-independent protein translocase protein TatA n=1 Tax=Candidatus Nitronauta litoralis TaxID=2705533 RepID=A0A7T0BY53_9BACT|nr:MAG: twin-arginine translocase TatA/TatE family subunit [Candidatus Nitronauta litoralis]